MGEVTRSAHTREENRGTQPLRDQPVFNNPGVVAEGWYPLGPSHELRKGTARSYLIAQQRLVAFRGEDGAVRVLDAFCPHMGADLGNGKVQGNTLACYFHQWRFDGAGELVGVKCGEKPRHPVKTRAWPSEERYGFIWAFAGERPKGPVPTCIGLEGREVHAQYLGATTLYAHHHVMMAGGIDLAHFGSVHDLDVTFELKAKVADDDTAEWRLSGELPTTGWRARVGRFLVGKTIAYAVRFAGGSAGGITYGDAPRLFGTGPRLPTLHLFWGCVPLKSGVSQVHAFVLTPRRGGPLGWLLNRLQVWVTFALLGFLQDDDVKAFPNMRFQLSNLTEADQSVAQFAKYVNALTPSAWSGVRTGSE
ncbi:MAG: Rieske 2Fe-2S domain-containing protein [Myxococcaceae bacterium]|nr:Rieske 2Fe-2S domain-containing protein [Myxococcaceae bacterium]